MNRKAINISWAFIALGMLGVFYSNLNPDAFSRNMVTDYFKNNKSILQPYLNADAIYDNYAKSGNVFVGFSGFDLSDEIQMGMMETFYFRGAYSLYPRKVYIADKDKVVNNARDMARHNVMPSIDMIQNNRIEYVLFLKNGSDDGGVGLNVYTAPRFIEKLNKVQIKQGIER